MSVWPIFLKMAAILLVAFILFHWFTGGLNEVQEGPPSCPEGSINCSTD